MFRWNKAPGTFWGKAAVAGLVGGVGMGLYEMVASALTGRGFWTPMTMIGATLPGFRPYSFGFAVGPSLTGLLLHLVTSAVWGLAFGAVVLAASARIARSWGGETLLGLLYGVAVWIVMGLGIGPALDPAMGLVPPGHFLVGHLVFGLVTAVVLTAWTRPKELAISFAPEIGVLDRFGTVHR